MLTPSLLTDWARDVLPEWDDVVRSVNDAFRVVWNPLIRRWAVVLPGPPDQAVEFAGYNYPGWIYRWTVEGPDGQYREPDSSLATEMANAASFSFLHPKTWQRRQWIRGKLAESQRAREAEDKKAMKEATDAAMAEVWRPARAGRVTVARGLAPGTSQRAYGWTR